MKQLIVNTFAIMIIGLGGYQLSGVQSANAAVINTGATVTAYTCSEGEFECTCNGKVSCESSIEDCWNNCSPNQQ